MDGIDLRDLQAFVCVARHRNFRRAAIEQRISVSSLSERLRALEERLGTRLLNRTTRSVSPTEAGEHLLLRLVPALAAVTDAIEDTRRREGVPAGRLRINAPAPAVQLVLAPMIAPFLKRYPEIRLELVVEPLLIDIVAAGYDAGVRYEEHLDQDMIALSLGSPQRYAVVAAPGLVAQGAIPARPEDLMGRPRIATIFPNGLVMPWEFEKEGRVVTLAAEARFLSSDVGSLVRAAIDGLGFLGTFEGYVAEAVADGQLVRVLADWCPPFPGPFLYYPSRRQPPPALAAFIGFAREWTLRSETAI
jgi:DNA-binding transcriptional LysR family regulator